MSWYSNAETATTVSHGCREAAGGLLEVMEQMILTSFGAPEATVDLFRSVSPGVG